LNFYPFLIGCYHMLQLGIGLLGLRQLSGINGVSLFYSINIFTSAS